MVVVHLLIVGVLLIVLQTTVLMRSPVGLLAPDLYFVLVAYLALRLDLLRSLIILFPLVCVLDVLSGTILGMHALLCFSGFFLLRQVAARLPVDEILYHLPLIGISFLVVSWLVYGFLELLLPGQQAVWSWWKMLMRTAMVVGCSYPLFFLLDLIQKFSQRRFLPWIGLRLRGDNRRRRQA